MPILAHLRSYNSYSQAHLHSILCIDWFSSFEHGINAPAKDTFGRPLQSKSSGTFFYKKIYTLCFWQAKRQGMSVPKTNENSNSPNLRKPSLTPSSWCFRQPSQAAKIHVEVDLDSIEGTSNYACCIFQTNLKPMGKKMKHMNRDY